MKRIKKISPVWFLRVGLGLVYLYSGYHILASPQAWSGFLPSFFSDAVGRIMPLEAYMRIHGGGELLMGLLLLIWFTPRWLLVGVAGLAAVEMAGILLFLGVDTTTFRDIGLLGASLSLLFSLRK